MKENVLCDIFILIGCRDFKEYYKEYISKFFLQQDRKVYEVWYLLVKKSRNLIIYKKKEKVQKGRIIFYFRVIYINILGDQVYMNIFFLYKYVEYIFYF